MDALDIGAGNGRDSVFLQESGFNVVALDTCPGCHERLENIHGVRFLEKDIFNFDLGSYDLVNASLVFPFLDREQFSFLWQRIQKSLRPRGCVSGHLFGFNDWKVVTGHAWGLSSLELDFNSMAGLFTILMKVIGLVKMLLARKSESTTTALCCSLLVNNRQNIT